MKKILIDIAGFIIFCGLVILFYAKCGNGQKILDKDNHTVYFCGESCSNKDAVVRAMEKVGLKRISAKTIIDAKDTLLEEKYQKRFLADSDIEPFFWSLHDFPSQDVYDANVTIVSDKQGQIKQLQVSEPMLAMNKNEQQAVRDKLSKQFEHCKEQKDSLQTTIYTSGKVTLIYIDNMTFKISIN